MCSVFFLYSLFIYYSLLFYLNSLPFTVSLIIVLLISDLGLICFSKKKSIRWKSGKKNLGENRLSRGASFPLAKERTVYDYDSDSITGQTSDWIRTLRIFIQFCLVITPVSVHSWSIQAQVTVSISSQAPWISIMCTQIQRTLSHYTLETDGGMVFMNSVEDNA